MLNNDLLAKYLSRASKAGYADIRTLGKNCIEVRLVGNTVETHEHEDTVVGCRALDKGYGVSSTNRIDSGHTEAAVDQAMEYATSINGLITGCLGCLYVQ